MRSSKSLAYVLRELLSPFFLSFFFLVVVILMFQAFRFTDVVLLFGTSLDTVVLLLKSLLISTFPIILPMCLLSAILLGYGRLGQDSELMALSAIGVPRWVLILPAILLFFFVFGASFYCSTYLGPLGIRASKILSNRLASATLKSSLRPGVFVSFSKMTMYSESFDKNTQEFKNFFVLDQRQDKAAVILSRVGQVKTPSLGVSVLNMKDGQMHYNPKQANHVMIDFMEYNFSVESKKREKRKLPIKALTNSEIRQFRKGQKKNRFKYTYELHKRLQLSLGAIVFLVLGLAFGFNVYQRVSRSKNIGLCIFLALSFWLVFFIFDGLVIKSKILFLLYVPNLLFLGLAIFWWKLTEYPEYVGRKR